MCTLKTRWIKWPIFSIFWVFQRLLCFAWSNYPPPVITQVPKRRSLRPEFLRDYWKKFRLPQLIGQTPAFFGPPRRLIIFSPGLCSPDRECAARPRPTRHRNRICWSLFRRISGNKGWLSRSLLELCGSDLCWLKAFFWLVSLLSWEWWWGEFFF